MKQSVKLIAGNWKMNGEAGGLAEFAALEADLAATPASARVAICPPATLVERLARAAQAVEVGGQDCHAEASGAFTGSVSGQLLIEAGARLVILGHSERRADCGETDAIVRAKVDGARKAGLEPIICVGETLAQRRAGETLAVVGEQLAGSLPDDVAATPFAIAYEPVWAIGTGLTPTLAQIEEVHAFIRRTLSDRFGRAGEVAPILYGGSVKPSNAAEILNAAEVGGALVGGASLKAADFLAIIRAV